MTAVIVTNHLTAPPGGWTADDLDAFPADGLRYELVDGAYAEVARVQGDEAYEATAPYPVRVVPAELVR